MQKRRLLVTVIAVFTTLGLSECVEPNNCGEMYDVTTYHYRDAGPPKNADGGVDCELACGTRRIECSLLSVDGGLAVECRQQLQCL